LSDRDFPKLFLADKISRKKARTIETTFECSGLSWIGWVQFGEQHSIGTT
jgi:hypothetical protein